MVAEHNTICKVETFIIVSFVTKVPIMSAADKDSYWVVLLPWDNKYNLPLFYEFLYIISPFISFAFHQHFKCIEVLCDTIAVSGYKFL